MAAVFPESRVVEIWRECLVGRTDLFTEEGEPLEVIYPGRPNDGRGADLRDAVIARSGGLIKGDIEVHVRSSGWWAHRHHNDPVYNRVVLHVVFTHDTTAPVVLQNGHEVPTLALGQFIEGSKSRCAGYGDSRRNKFLPCRHNVNHGQALFIGDILDTAGDKRFELKADELREKLSRIDAGQLLYREIMRALGYSRNKEPMEELARRVTLKRLEAETRGESECLERLQAILLGTAGLINSPRSGLYADYGTDEAWLKKLARLWETSGERPVMLADDWCLFKVRPVNLPARRIVAMSYLLLRFRHEGLLKGMLGRFGEIPAETGGSGLYKMFLIEAEDYRWQLSYFGMPALLGKGRADDIVINVLLPFAAAWGRADSRPALAEKALEIYRRYYCLNKNTIERHMAKQLGIRGNIISTARRQQGLLHIFKTLCSQGKCRECPLG
jgi:hypothetical protein